MWVREFFLVDHLENLMIAADPLLRKCTSSFLPIILRGLRTCGMPSMDPKILFGD